MSSLGFRTRSLWSWLSNVEVLLIFGIVAYDEPWSKFQRPYQHAISEVKNLDFITAARKLWESEAQGLSHAGRVDGSTYWCGCWHIERTWISTFHPSSSETSPLMPCDRVSHFQHCFQRLIQCRHHSDLHSQLTNSLKSSRGNKEKLCKVGTFSAHLPPPPLTPIPSSLYRSLSQIKS